MTKAEFVSTIATKAGLTKKDSEMALNAVLDSIQTLLSDGDNITFIGFGAFSVVERAARTARNPKTGQEIKLPATKAIKFKIGKNLKDSVVGSKKK